MQKTLSNDIEVYVQHRRPFGGDCVFVVDEYLGYVFEINPIHYNPDASQCVPLKINNGSDVDVLRWARKGEPSHYWFLPTFTNLLNTRLFMKHKKVDVPPELLNNFLGYFDLPHLIKDNENPVNNLMITGKDVYDRTREFISKLEELDLF